MSRTMTIIGRCWRTAVLAATLLLGSLLLVAEPKCDIETWRWFAAILISKAAAVGLIALAVWLARTWDRQGSLSLPKALTQEEEEE